MLRRPATGGLGFKPLETSICRWFVDFEQDACIRPFIPMRSCSRGRRSSVVKRTLRLLEKRRHIGKARIALLASKRAPDQIVDAGDRLSGPPVRHAQGKTLFPLMK